MGEHTFLIVSTFMLVIFNIFLGFYIETFNTDTTEYTIQDYFTIIDVNSWFIVDEIAEEESTSFFGSFYDGIKNGFIALINVVLNFFLGLVVGLAGLFLGLFGISILGLSNILPAWLFTLYTTLVVLYIANTMSYIIGKLWSGTS